MPTRSLTSSVLKWPSQDDVKATAQRWASTAARRRPEVIRIGMFGSYARGDAGVGSDLDLVAIVRKADDRHELRAKAWGTTRLPVPVDLLVYTEEEWARVRSRSQFGTTLEAEVTWLYERTAGLAR